MNFRNWIWCTPLALRNFGSQHLRETWPWQLHPNFLRRTTRQELCERTFLPAASWVIKLSWCPPSPFWLYECMKRLTRPVFLHNRPRYGVTCTDLDAEITFPVFHFVLATTVYLPYNTVLMRLHNKDYASTLRFRLRCSNNCFVNLLHLYNAGNSMSTQTAYRRASRFRRARVPQTRGSSTSREAALQGSDRLAMKDNKT